MRNPEIREEILEAADGAQLTDEKRQQRAARCNQRKPLHISHFLHVFRPQSLLLRLCQFAALGASVGVITLILPNAHPTASADGVVINSSAPNYARGDIVKDGQSISLAPEQSISILNPAGDLLTFTEPGVFGEISDTDPSNLSAWDALTWNKHRSAVGGTRAQSYEDCIGQEEMTVDDCDLIYKAGDTAPELDLKFLGNAKRFRKKQPIRLSLKANFKAQLFCEITDGSEYSEPLRYGKNDAYSVLLMSGAKTLLPKRGGNPVAAPRAAGHYIISCVAIDAQALQIVQDADTDPAEGNTSKDVAIKFAEISGAPLARASILLDIVE